MKVSTTRRQASLPRTIVVALLLGLAATACGSDKKSGQDTDTTTETTPNSTLPSDSGSDQPTDSEPNNTASATHDDTETGTSTTDTGTGTGTGTTDTGTGTGPTDTGTGSDTTQIVGGDLTITSATARSCDVVLAASSGSKISGVTFDDAVLGKAGHRAPHTAISLITKNDESFPAPAAQIKLASAGAATSPTVVSAKCYDKQGKPIANPGVEVR